MPILSKAACRVFSVLMILSFLFPDAVQSFTGPLQVNNLYPLFFQTNQPYLESASQENSFSLLLSHGSTYTVEHSDRWLIHMDMEISEFSFRWKRIIRGFLEFEIGIPVIIFGSGFMDGFLDAYHSTFGFSDYGRSNRPLHSFLYEVRKDGKPVIEGGTGTGFGDARIGLKKPLFTSGNHKLSFQGTLEIPTGNAEKGFGNGSVDSSIALLLNWSMSEKVMTYWNIGGVFPGAGKFHSEIDYKNYAYGSFGLEASVWNNLSLLAQLQVQSSPFPETDIPAVDRTAYMLAFGGRYAMGRNLLEFSLTEDINTSGAPDFIVNLTYKVKM